MNPGDFIGCYTIVSPLGAGGMGEVYRARDSKLKREVAIKVLPADVASDRERLARFQREAEVLASLNHPHIAHVYGIEEKALVMELVEGEDLSQRIARGPIPIDEALPIAKQIAEALEAAHDAGIIHRDLKPANIKVRDDGTVKVLDFGLAKAQGSGIGDQGSGDIANSPTITSPAMTMRGVILGTAAYMSPEQAKGKSLDKRADIWAFGCVLFEMLTGKRTFKGDDVTDIITSVMRDTPDWSALPAETPATIRTLLRRCLEKDPRKRVPHMAVARLEIDDSMLSTGDLVGGPAVDPAPRRAAWPLALGIGAAMAVAASAITFLATRPTGSSDATPALRYTIDLPVSMTTVNVAVSPNGYFVAVSGRAAGGFSYIWVRPLDGNEFTQVPGSQLGTAPFWSPDSTEVAFFSNRKLMRARVPGGASQELIDMSTVLENNTLAAVSGAWTPDGAILIAGPGGIHRVMSSGGPITKVTEEASAERKPTGYLWPAPLPGQAGLLYSHVISNAGNGGALLFRSASGLSSSLIGTRSRAINTRPGLLVAESTGASSASLKLHRFDASTGTLELPGTMIVDDASLEFGASDNGVIAYRRSRASTPYRFEWVDREGRATGDTFATVDTGPFNLSRDGTLLAYMEGTEVIVRDLTRGVGTPLVSNAVEPILSPDGRRIAYSLPNTSPPSIVVQPSSGGTPTVVFKSESLTLVEDWSSDGKYLVANQLSRGLIIPLDSAQQPSVYTEGPAGTVLDESRFSPDGRWLLYNGGERGSQEVFLIPLPPTGERWQLSLSGGSQARWRPDGDAVYYMNATGDIMTLDLALAEGQRPKIGGPRKLFATGLRPTPNIDQYAPSSDGTRFLLRRPGASDQREQLNVIVNWPSLLPKK